MDPTTVWRHREAATHRDQDQLHFVVGAAPRLRIAARHGRKASSALALTIVAAIGAAIGAGCARPGAVLAPPSFAPVVALAAPAVVGIAERAAEAATPNAVALTPVTGSGFRIERTAFVATAAHVVQALRNPPVIVWNGRRWNARIRWIDQESDLALLDIDGSAPIPGLALAESPHDDPGSWVVVLGCPFGTLPTATVGIVSARPGAVLRPEPLRSQLQLNAAVNPGNSGGPVVNLNAEVIGIATAQVPGGHGLGFAIPVATLRRLLARQN